MVYNRICECCGLPIPDPAIRTKAMDMPCSELHIRCLRCAWSVAKDSIDEDEICNICKGKKV